MSEFLPVRTTCPYCGVGCGVLVTPDGRGGATVAGDPEHPANFGRLCSKGSALGETLDLEQRLLSPVVNGQARGWDDALGLVADKFRSAIESHGPDSVAFYLSGQLLTEDYYVANKLMKGFIGSNNIDTNSRLCMSSSVTGHVRAFGSDTVPGCYEDLEQARLIVLVGSNTAWCHPVLYQRILAAKAENGCRIVVIDPRRTATCDGADLHLPLKPGSDVMLFNGLLVWLADHHKLAESYLADHVSGLGESLAAARADAPDLARVSAVCGLSETDLQQFYSWFCQTEQTVTVYSQGVNQSSSGSDKVNAILNCHLATGRIGRPGMGPFSVTGQPNAMGGREVGGLANMLACHLSLEAPDDRALAAEFWGGGPIAPEPGLKAVALFEAIERGEIKALWVMGTNPVVSLPDAERFRRALAACEFLVVSDCTARTDTAELAEVLLPARTWGEKEGTVTNSERRISRQRTFLPPPGQARPDWWIVAQVAQRMGYPGFEYTHPVEIFREYARLSGYQNGGRRGFDIGALQEIATTAYDDLSPQQWPINQANPTGQARFFAEGGYYTRDGRANMLALRYRPPATAVDEVYPLVLNTGRVRDHWHTMTRTGKTARLSSHRIEPLLEMNPTDAAKAGFADGQFVRVESRQGETIARLMLDSGTPPGSLYLPMHWNRQFASGGLAGPLVNPVVDPHSGQPEFKHTPVRLKPVELPWRAFIGSRQPLHHSALFSNIDYWVATRADGCWRYELAAAVAPSDPAAWIGQQLPPTTDWIDYQDGRHAYRAAGLIDGQLAICLFSGGELDGLSREWLLSRFVEPALNARTRAGLLAGLPAEPGVDPGRIVCACFQVGINTLTQAITEQRLTTPEQIGQALKAGTNCGSCVPEITALLAPSGGAVPAAG